MIFADGTSEILAKSFVTWSPIGQGFFCLALAAILGYTFGYSFYVIGCVATRKEPKPPAHFLQ